MTESPHRVVVIGGGFGGLLATKSLARAPVEITLIDRRNFHLFQPLTYQIATGALSPAEVCYPLRAIFKRNRNVRVMMGEVTEVDLDGRELLVDPGAGALESDPGSLRHPDRGRRLAVLVLRAR